MDDDIEPRYADTRESERRRQQPGRRASDAAAFREAVAFEVIDEDVREIAVAIKKVQVGWKKWLGFAVAVGTVMSAILGTFIWLGGRNLSPAEVREAQRKEMNTEILGNRAATSVVADHVSSLDARVSNLEDATDLISYLLCVQIRRTDPTALPPRCNDASIRKLAPK